MRSFIEEKAPKSDIQFVTAIAHYYRFQAPEADRRETIGSEFAQEATRLANWDRLKNPLSTLKNAVTKGYLNRGARGEFSINTVGENLVARTLPGSKAESSSRGKTKSAKAGKKTATKKGKEPAKKR